MANREKGTKKGLGLNKIFDLFDSGVRPQDISRLSDEIRAREEEGRIKGAQSELNAIRSLRCLGYVERVRQTSKDRRHDYLSHDLEVKLDPIACVQFLDNGLAIPNRQLFAQIVSSQGGIDHFTMMTKARIDSNRYEDFERYLVNEKLVILNGQLPLLEIQYEFRRQLINLNLAWALRQ